MNAFMKTRRWPELVIGLATALMAFALLLRYNLQPRPGPAGRNGEPSLEGYSLEESDALRAQTVEEARQMALKASLHVY